jgi:predicted DNA-binding transcriptional regulator YafY
VAVQLHENLSKLIHFEDTYLPTGTVLINPILDAIQYQQVIKVTYQKFDSEVIKENILHPYLLKEFKNRWYVLGFNPKYDFLKTYALDRIKQIEIVKDQVYKENKEIDAQSFFSNVIGVSNPTDEVQEVKIIVKPSFAEYIKTQPLHHSQTILNEDDKGLLIQLKVVHNVELETLICGYASYLIIQSPETLKTAIKERLKSALNNF